MIKQIEGDAEKRRITRNIFHWDLRSWRYFPLCGTNAIRVRYILWQSERSSRLTLWGRIVHSKAGERRE